ncbi:hypothetical protein V1517DRAFT_197856 [Lipomyces orientalis]|uniref:Uncharacterized protein n=1 Tax=Lipomyces orientalis TaxID=1233043 RepID=A0ACC3TIC7_9ASCO
MAQLDAFDVFILGAVLVGTVAYFTKGTLWAKKRTASALVGKANGTAAVASTATRSIITKLQNSDRDVVVFYGSQTGTAEDYASRLAKEGHSRFGLKTMVADIEEYDLEDLDTFPEDKVAIFVMATYGEGEPTDNAATFYEFITGDDPQFSEMEDPEKPLKNLKYVAFGLGNNTYEHYNAVIVRLNEALLKLGANRIGEVGMGDDGTGTMEEDFLSWKEEMWSEFSKHVGVQEREAVYEPALKVEEKDGLTTDDANVFLGEFNKAHLQGTHSAPFLPHNPYIAPITSSRELFKSDSRNCLHVEIDLEDSNLKFTTGDHVAIWPQNSDKEVDRFLSVLGLTEKRDTVISVTAIDPTAKVPFPNPTTYDAVVRYHLEICGVVSRQFLASLAPYAPSDEAKAEITKLGNEKDYFSEVVSSRYFNIAQVLQRIAGGATWSSVPFPLIIESINHIQPRYYSISSSSYVEKTKPHITVVVESIPTSETADPLKGVASNYLLDLKYKQEGINNPSPSAVSYATDGPRGKYVGNKIPVHIRHSNFKLPSNPATPIIMVGPGTGVAPFRGFVHERAAQAGAGVPVGTSLLFFGSRNRTEDFLYSEEWEALGEKLGDKFKLVTAFSREGPEKVYVQHRLVENADLVNKLLQDGAYFYVCGDASRMAKDVSASLAKIISQQRDIAEEQGEEIVKSMRAQNLYQEDVWS